MKKYSIFYLFISVIFLFAGVYGEHTESWVRISKIITGFGFLLFSYRLYKKKL